VPDGLTAHFFGAIGLSTVSNILVSIGLGGIVATLYFIDHVHATYWGGHWLLFVSHTINALFIALVICAIALSGSVTRFLFENRIVVFLGTISYSLYLWHLPIIVWIAHAIDMNSMTLSRFSLIAAPPVILASALSYYLVERPFLQRKSISGGDKQPKAASGTAHSSP
jgi:peptidoglycan/LPS O-acetylase OafA/YrhL